MQDPAMAAIEKQRQKADVMQKRKSEEARSQKAACECFATESGQRVLLWLMKECGFLEPSCVLSPTTLEINKESTVYNEAKRDVYLRLRKLLRSRPDVLANVEINQLKGETE